MPRQLAYAFALRIVMSTLISGEQRQVVLLDDEPLEYDDRLKYLGSMFIANGQGADKTRRRMSLARFAFSRQQSCPWTRRCVQRVESTRQWCDRFYSTVAKRDLYEWPTKGWWRFLTVTVSATPYTLDAEIVCQRQNCGADSTSPTNRRCLTKEEIVGSATLQDVLRMKLAGTSFCTIRAGGQLKM